MTADRTLMRANTIREGGFHRKIIMKLNLKNSADWGYFN